MIASIDLITSFPTLDERALRAEILAKGMMTSYTAGEVLMNFGKKITHIPLVLAGGLRILREDGASGKEVFLYYVRPGGTCAMSMSCCTNRQASQIKAIAEHNTQLIMIPVENMELWLKKYPSWKNFIFETYQQSYDKLMDYVNAISFQKLGQRILTYLSEKAAINGTTTFHLTHQVIANELNSSREAVSRLLKKLEQEKKVKLGRNYIKVIL